MHTVHYNSTYAKCLQKRPAKGQASSPGCQPVVRSADGHGKAQQGTAVSPHNCSEMVVLQDDPINARRMPKAVTIHVSCG